MPKIDGENFPHGPQLKITRGSGDSETVFHIETMRSGHSGESYWMLEEKEKRWLYLYPSKPPERGASAQVRTVHETFEASRVEPHRFAGKEISLVFRWARMFEPLAGHPAPFHDTCEALLLGDGSYVRALPAIPVLHYRGELFTPDYPAEKMPWRLLNSEPVSALRGLGATIALSFTMALLFGLFAAAGLTWPVTLFWWTAPLTAILCFGRLGRRSELGHLARLISGAFFIHFLTRGFDVAVTGAWEDSEAALFECWKLCGMFLGLALLTRLRPQLTFGLIDGAYRVGPALWATGLVIMLIMLEDGNYFPWFNYYAGVMPWGLLLGAVGLVSMGEKIWDYRKAPVDKRGFLRLLYRTADVLEKGPEAAASRSARLAEWADDLEDALSISASPQVVALSELGPEFLLWKTQAIALASYHEFSPARQSQVQADLAVIAEDFRQLAETLDGKNAKKLSTPRPSPYLATYNQD